MRSNNSYVKNVVAKYQNCTGSGWVGLHLNFTAAFLITGKWCRSFKYCIKIKRALHGNKGYVMVASPGFETRF
jgi:hypothetical protein